MYQRITRGAPAPLRFELDEQPDSATVTLTRPDGTVLVDAEAATPEVDGASYELAAEHTERLGLLTCELAVTVGLDVYTVYSYVEVVGGRMFRLAELRKLDPLDDEAEFPDERLERLRTLVEVALEDACERVAFVPRGARVTLDGGDAEDILLPHVEPHRLVAVEVDGVALTAAELAECELEDYGALYRPDGWPLGRRNVTVEYEHGYRFPPGRVPFAAMRLARYFALDSPLDDRAVSITNEHGSTQLLVQSGVKGAVFAVPEANAVVRQYAVKDVAI